MEAFILFREYMGRGLLLGWFLISVLYLFFVEKRKPLRILFVYLPVIVLLLFFNPLFAKIFTAFGEIYYRILWLLPITLTIAFAAVTFCESFRGRARAGAAFVLAVLVMLSGSLIYRDIYFQKAENLYHIPQTVVEICDAIEIDGREVMALFPDEMLQYVRQYSPVICMPYGREVLVWTENELHALMQKETIDLDQLAGLAKEYQCHYVILPKDRKWTGNLLEHDYILFDTIDGYQIYKDTTMNFSVVPM